MPAVVFGDCRFSIISLKRMFLDKEFFERNGFTVEVEVTPYCNFACRYCENSRD